MIRRASIVAALAALSLLAGGSATVAAASPPDGVDEDTVAVRGVEYGPEDGLEVDVQQFAIQPGQGPVGVTYASDGMGRAQWGTSYAISTERLQLWYDGKAKAAGNVYSGKRIIQVCFWYSRGGSSVSTKMCSAAYSVGMGLWTSGPEVKKSVRDSLNPVAPQTIFNISTVRINP